METLKQKYPQRDIYMIHYEDIDTSFNIPLDALENPFDYVPKIQTLTQKEHKLLAKLEKQTSWESKEYSVFRELQNKRGKNLKLTNMRRKNLNNLLEECKIKVFL